MNYMNLRSEEFVLYATFDNCETVCADIKVQLRQLLKEKKIVGYSCRIIENEGKALDEDIEVDTNQQYPFVWLNITFDIENFDKNILLELKEKYKLVSY